MTTFARRIFDAGKYAAVRPTYPRMLYDAIFAYHARGGAGADAEEEDPARWTRALDLGCGTGQATAALVTRSKFREVIGVDPSAPMVAQAREQLFLQPGQQQPSNDDDDDAAAAPAAATATAIRIVQSPAESLPFIEDASVDLVISAQAAHWFDYARLWPELARVLRKSGTVAFWGYSQFRITGFPALTPLIREYVEGALGPHWEQPGRGILDNHLRDVPQAPPALESGITGYERIYWTGEEHDASLPEGQRRPIILQKYATWEELEAYLRTFSALYRYQEVHPEDAGRRTGQGWQGAGTGGGGGGGGGGGDVVERFWWSLQEGVARERGGSAGEGVMVEWPMTLLLCRKAA